jgi:hypothetical protein
MKYMLLINVEQDAAPEQRAPWDAWMAYTEALRQAGAYVAGDALQGRETATTVRVRDDETVITDGPFAETKELLGGYYLIDVPDLDTALGWAAKIPAITYGSVEVRPLMEAPVPAQG